MSNFDSNVQANITEPSSLQNNIPNVSTNKKIYIQTYGCQMNEYDSEKILELMQKDSYITTQKYDEADLIILNTCQIREKAAEKVYSELGRIKKATVDKQPIVVIAGCVGQAQGEEIFKRANNVDIVVGPQSYHDLSNMVKRAFENKETLKNLNNSINVNEDLTKSIDKKKTKKLRQINIDFIEEKKFDFLEEELFIQKKSEINSNSENFETIINTTKTIKNNYSSSFVSVQEGCDKFCHFCVVPFTRGAEFSRPLEQIMREIFHHVSNGAKEVVLLGQNVNAYHGKYQNQEINLASLIRHVAKIPQIQRIRFTTSHPRDMNEDLINLFGSEPKLMPFFNLPIQSGSNKILKAMNRKYTREFYLEIIAKLKKVRPDIAMSSDFIVGYPGESDEDFEDTIKIVKEVQFAQSYSFKYSVRPGTKAAEMEQLDEKIKTERLIRLQKVIQNEQQNFNNQFLGKVLPVLFDRVGKFDNQIVGRTPYMQSIYLNNAQNLKNQIINVKVTNVYNNGLGGELI